MLLGLTGGYAAGKSTVAALLAQRGWHSIDVDALGHAALALVADRVLAHFGPRVRGPDNSLSRKALASLLFDDPAALASHEAIVHPVMLRLLDAEIDKAKGANTCIDAALLYRFAQLGRCDAVIEVQAPEQDRIRRGFARDALSPEAVRARIARQESLWLLRPAEKPPVYILANTGSLSALARNLDVLLARIDRRDKSK